jgi:elongation factor Ts
MVISATMVNELRTRTGAGLMDCKGALVETQGNMDAAADILRKKGAATRDKKAGRDASEGIIQSYIHSGSKIGVLVELNCESDFVARNEAFVELARDIAMHIAASNPRWVTPDEVPAEAIAKEKDIIIGTVAAQYEAACAQALEAGRPAPAPKPAAAIEKIIEGKIASFLADNCLVNQKFVKNPDVTINDLLIAIVQKLGENTRVSRFARFQIGA